MKRLNEALVLLVLVGITVTARAADCRVNGGAWQPTNPGGGVDFQVRVNVRPEVNSPRILLEGVRLECRFTPNGSTPNFQEDYWATGARVGPSWTPGPKFTTQSNGLRINGTYRDNPIPYGIRMATMPNNGSAVLIDVLPYILLRNHPVTPIDVRAGDIVGTLRLDQTNNYDSLFSNVVLVYTANNNFTVSPSTCTINNNNPIVIDFNDVHQRAIGTDPLTSTVRTNRRLNYSCPGPGSVTSPITITYQGTPSSFNANLLTMSNPDVGTALVRGGAAVRVNGSFLSQITNNSGGDDVTFALVKRAGTLPAAGPINGSGVLVMGVP
ncbi:fimbrial protein [Pseudomonas sp. PAMC 25886]|uniref:fimbrial protein n=1 Tax=Pseudomonas sp. PAMC 25886 TaxID=1125977 RepID=UPI00049536EE|nr:fimbrial protein [Pseudomonas sp. PAMC 25886]